FKLTESLNRLNLPGVLFRPISYKPYYGVHKDKNLNGIQFFVTDLKKCNLTSIQFYVLQELKKLYPEKNIFEMAKPERISSFDKAAGWDKIRILFSKNFKYDDIRVYWEKEADEFKSKAKKYFLY
ncbi:MAG: DUF1343 domain-containing protein, partial [Ignavibacteria bacterium]|nr:DUF1343 domain-containing protein [Ignavibacteria bacterium]